VGLGAHELAQTSKLIGAEMIWLVHLGLIGVLELIVNPEVGAPGACRPRSNAITPVVTVGEAATRPAKHARLDPAHLLNERRSNAADVGNLRAFADPHTVVDDSAEMLDEMAIDLWRDGADRLVN